ncbi:Hypothetical predicted protein [Marmota monax]|uniref:Protein kinase domain-containing protein n=1 Tax=Marmota monax TaxID=9995 RepID=A0A5E4BGU6_MARMO|nr:hypothetical protein GHT09_013751 [Marmota monax]VTJ68914.1 Hypothetical predicted protein [Marmota monax]
MEPGPRRRRRSHQPVAAFLRDPSSGRVYRRGKLIGKGAFSRCYKLTDMSTSAVFALKVVPRAGRLPSRGKTGACGDGPQVEREIALHSRLRHHNIVAFHGHFADRDHVYMVLEYCSRQVLGEGEPAARPLSICSHPCQCHLLFSVQSTCFLCPCMAICVHPSLTCAHQEPPVPTCAHLCSVHAVVIRLISCSCVATVPT